MTEPRSAARISTRSRAWFCSLAGGILWAAGLLVVLPNPFAMDWAKALLLLAPLVLVPLGLDLAAGEGMVGQPGRLWHLAKVLQLPAAILFGVAFFLPQGLLASGLAAPWLGTTVAIAFCGLLRFRQRGFAPWSAACVDIGLIYLAVGGVWAVADRLGFRPLGFEEVIVLLTAIHFHYAGFVLPIVTGLAMRHIPGPVARVAGFAVVLGVPLVAVGITATQLGAGPLLECLAAYLLAAAGTLAAWLHLRLARQPAWPVVIRCLWVVAAISLFGSMALAATYGSRFYVSVAWLDIPWMRVLHGTANALGFGLAGLLGWWLESKQISYYLGWPPGRGSSLGRES